MAPPIRIVVGGSGGSGKTSFIKALANALPGDSALETVVSAGCSLSITKFQDKYGASHLLEFVEISSNSEYVATDVFFEDADGIIMIVDIELPNQVEYCQKKLAEYADFVDEEIENFFNRVNSDPSEDDPIAYNLLMKYEGGQQRNDMLRAMIRGVPMLFIANKCDDESREQISMPSGILSYALNHLLNIVYTRSPSLHSAVDRMSKKSAALIDNMKPVGATEFLNIEILMPDSSNPQYTKKYKPSVCCRPLRGSTDRRRINIARTVKMIWLSSKDTAHFPLSELVDFLNEIAKNYSEFPSTLAQLMDALEIKS